MRDMIENYRLVAERKDRERRVVVSREIRTSSFTKLMREAVDTERPGRVMTSDVGKCRLCGSYTSSGMKRLCVHCVTIILDCAADELERAER